MTSADLATERLDWAAAQLADCRLCPRDCRVDRASGETGWCGAGAEARVFAEFVHYGEEAELSPSHTVYLKGCNLRCVFCHTAPERQRKEGDVLTADLLRRLVERGQRQGARNVNFLGGEPMVSLPALLTLIAESPALPPLVWNTSLYCGAEALAAVCGLPAVYLADLKFGNAACASRLCGADDYCDVVRARLAELWAREPEKLIVRHSVLPGHLECCTRPALEWLARLGRVRVSLKADYLVMPAARGTDELGRFLTEAEIREAHAIAADLDIELVPQSTPEAALSGETEPDETAPVMMDAEVVISPRGEILLRHPTRGLTAAALAATDEPRGEQP